MRIDGRAVGEMRPVEVIVGYQEYAEGSVLINMGRTRVLCAATIEEEVPPWVTSAGWAAAQYAMLPRATRIRTPRAGSAREIEIQQLIGRAMRASIDLDALGRRTIIVDCDAIQADGGTRTAAITGGYIALALALKRLVHSKDVPEEVWRAPVAAMSVALTDDGEMLLDPCHEEDIRAIVDCDIVLNANGELIEVEAPGAIPYSRAQLEQMLDLAIPAICRLTEIQREILAS